MAIDIQAVLAMHLKWSRGEKDGARANLTGANLTGARGIFTIAFGAKLQVVD
jgi:hypothetical protein